MKSTLFSKCIKLKPLYIVFLAIFACNCLIATKIATHSLEVCYLAWCNLLDLIQSKQRLKNTLMLQSKRRNIQYVAVIEIVLECRVYHFSSCGFVFRRIVI